MARIGKLTNREIDDLVVTRNAHRCSSHACLEQRELDSPATLTAAVLGWYLRKRIIVNQSSDMQSLKAHYNFTKMHFE